MTSKWKPGLSIQRMEEAMEDKDIPEDDRDEVRRFAEVLRRLKDKREGKSLSPPPDGMKEWLEGKE